MTPAADGEGVGEAQLQVVDDPVTVDLSREQVALSVGAFTALGLAVPDDFGRPGARPQIMLDDEASIAAFTLAAVIPGGDSGESLVAMGDPDRLFAGSVPSATVRATTDLFASGQLREAVTTSGDVAVIAPHGGGIEAHTDDQVALLVDDDRLQLDTWVCEGRGTNQLRRLHITSDDISELSFPGFRGLLEREHSYAVSFHGFRRATHPGTGAPLDVIVGGQLDVDARYDIADRIRHRLVPTGSFAVFVVTSCGDPFPGLSPRNVVNRLARCGGVQIEQSQRLRSSAEATLAVAEAVVDMCRAEARRP